MSNETFKLIDRAEDILNNRLVLPSFQRKYVWNDNDKQQAFLASILAKIPLGNIITFKDKKDSFACRIIGLKDEFAKLNTSDIEDEYVEYLLDGQQRITTLLLIFSDRLFYKNGKTETANRLIDGGQIRKRFFLQLPPYNAEELTDSDDFFGFLSLNLPFNDIPNFCSRDIVNSKIIEIKSFLKSDDKNWFSPKSSNEEEQTSLEISAANDNKIPLFWLLDYNDRISNVLNELAHRRATYLFSTYKSVSAGGKKSIESLNEIFEMFDKKKIGSLDDKTLEKNLNSRAKKWAHDMSRYLENCINELKIYAYEVTKEGKERAIDIYQALNEGGVKLHTYDLVVAKAAKEDGQLNSLVDTTVSEYCNKTLLECLNNDCRDWNGKLFKAYTDRDGVEKKILDQFLNLLAIVSYHEIGKMENLNIDDFKEKKILDLSPTKINKNSKNCIEAIMDAMMYLNLKCGICRPSSIKYDLTILPIAYVFYIVKVKGYNLKEDEELRNFLFSVIDAWYKTAIYTDFYREKQNMRVKQDISDIDSLIINKVIPDYFSDEQIILDNVQTTKFEDRISKVLNVKYYNDWNMLVYNDLHYIVSDSVEQYIYYYYLSLPTMVDAIKNELNQVVPIHSFDFKTKFEIHHFIPLYADKSLKENEKLVKTEKYRDDKTKLINSSLNKVMISSDANGKISSLTPDRCRACIPDEFISNNDFSVGNFINNTSLLVSEANLNNIFKDRYIKLKGRIQSDIRNSVRNIKNYISSSK